MAGYNDLTARDKKILDRANSDDRKPADIQAGREILNANPEIWQHVGNLAKQNVLRILDPAVWPPLVADSVQNVMREKRIALGYEESSQLEQMVIDMVMLAWLRWQDIEYRYTALNQSGQSMAQGTFWDKRLTGAHNRYLRACETLARIRKLSRSDPTLQVNINSPDGQQLNMIGDLVRCTPQEGVKKP